MDHRLPDHDSVTSAHHSGAGSQSINSGAGSQANNTFGGPYSQQFNGPVSFHAPQRQSDFVPLSLLPSFSFHDDDFVWRKEIEELSGKLEGGGKRVAVFGLSGIGKTRLAVEYCRRLTRKRPDIWVLWADASSAVRFDRDIQRLALDLGIAGHDKQVAYAYQSLRRWLLDKKRTWLFVLDNADNIDFLYHAPRSANAEAGARSRIDCLPVFDNGSLLVTTRYLPYARRLVGRERKNRIEMTPDKTHAIAMLQKLLEPKIDMSILIRLAEAFDSIPLAVAQAATRVNREAPHCSPENYLLRLEGDEALKLHLLTEGADEAQGDYEGRRSMMLEWTMTLERINENRPSAAHLLCLMSFYNHQGIPKMLICEANNKADSTEQLADRAQNSRIYNSTNFNEDVLLLQDYAFITIRDKGDLNMPRLLQLTVHDWIKQRAQYKKWQSESLTRLLMAFPEAAISNRETCLTLYPHVKAAMVLKPLEPEAMLSLAAVAYRCSEFLYMETYYVAAGRTSRLAMDLYETILGQDRPKTLLAMYKVGIFLSLDRRHGQAEPIFQRVWQMTEQKYGSEHLETLFSGTSLARALVMRRNYEASEKMQRQVLNIREMRQGPKHLDTLEALSVLANILQYQRKSEAAEAIGRRVLASFAEVYGQKSHWTMQGCEALAGIMGLSGKLDIAENLLRSALTARETCFGPDHRCARRCRSGLARILLHRKQYDAAREICQRHVAELKDPSVEEIWEVGDVHSLLAKISQDQGNYEAAGESCRTALAAIEVLGNTDTGVLWILECLRNIRAHQGRYEDAKTVARRHLDGTEKLLGLEHPSTIASVSYLANLLYRTGEHVRALAMYERVRVRYTKAYGPTHEYTTRYDTTIAHLQSLIQTAQANSGNPGKKENGQGPGSPQKRTSMSLVERFKVTLKGNSHKA